MRSLPYASRTAPTNSDDRGVVALDEDRSQPGFNLYSIRDECRAELIDARGEVVHAWQDRGCRHWSHAELLPDGDLLVTGMADSEEALEHEERLAQRFLLRLDWSGEIVLRANLPAHHDAELTSDGDVLLLTMEYRQVPELGPTPILDNSLVRVDAGSGEESDRLSLFDVFASAPAPELQEVRPGKGFIDLFHANAVEWIEPGHVLFTSRHQDLVGLVDWSERRLLWTWGRGEISGPHDPSLLEDGHVLLFDNGLERGWSRVVEVDVGSGEIVWRYQAENPPDFFSASRGSSQRLANGNTLIAESDKGRAFEVTPEGDIVWDFYCPYVDADGTRPTIVRMKRYDVETIRSMVRAARSAPGP